MVAASILWGTTGTMAVQAPRVSPLAIGAAAMGIGGLLQAAGAARAAYAHRVALRTQWSTLAASALAVGVYPLAFYSSMRLAGVAIGTMVSIGSAPMVARVIERIVDHQLLSRRWATGAVFGMLGVIALAIGGAQPTGLLATKPGQLKGILLGLVAGTTYAGFSWGATRVIRTGVPSRPTMGVIFGLGGVLLLPVLFATGAPILESTHNLAVASYLAIVPMFIGYVLFGRGLALISASIATSVSLLEPLVATLLATLILHQYLVLIDWAGMGSILFSIFILIYPSRPAGLRQL